VWLIFLQEGLRRTDEWKNLNPLQLGILSWHLGNFYVLQWWDIERSLGFPAETGDAGTHGDARVPLL
jgi:hypothetical protein